jgi:hypothetical protein
MALALRPVHDLSFFLSFQGSPGQQPIHNGCAAGPNLKERKKERLRTGLSASAMGPRAVAGGECTKGNHEEN